LDSRVLLTETGVRATGCLLKGEGDGEALGGGIDCGSERLFGGKFSSITMAVASSKSLISCIGVSSCFWLLACIAHFGVDLFNSSVCAFPSAATGVLLCSPCTAV